MDYTEIWELTELQKLSREKQVEYWKKKLVLSHLGKESAKEPINEKLNLTSYNIDNSLIDSERYTKDLLKDKKAIEYLYNGVVAKNKANILASHSGIGKSLLSIEIGKSENVTKPLYILTSSDINDSHRYDAIFDKGGKLAGINEINTWKEELVRRYKVYLQNEGLKKTKLESEQPLMYKVIKNYRKLYKEYGIKNDTLEKLSDFTTLVLLLLELREKYDLIVIDSFSGIVNTKYITSKKLGFLIANTLKFNSTLVIVHHTIGKTSTLRGAREIHDSFGCVYVLHEINVDKKHGMKLLELEVVKDNYNLCSKNIKFIMEQVSDYEAAFSIIKDEAEKAQHNKDYIEGEYDVVDEGIKVISFKKILDNLTVKEAIIHVVENHNAITITLDKLHEEVNKLRGEKCGINTLKKDINKIGKLGYISKYNGRTWGVIKINNK